MVQEAASWLQFHQKVHVTLRSFFSPGQGAEDPDIVCSMPGSNLKDLLPFTLQNLFEAHICSFTFSEMSKQQSE